MTKNNLTERLHSVVNQQLEGNWAELARITKLQPSTLQAVKVGSDPRGNTLIGICDALNVNADWLLTGKGEMYRQQQHSAVEPQALGVVRPAAILNRLYSLFQVHNDADLSLRLDEKAKTLAEWREQGQVPYETCAQVSEQQKISLKWIITGFGDKHGTATMDRRMYIMNQLMEALPDQQQQEILAIIKEKERINTLERQIAALTNK